MLDVWRYFRTVFTRPCSRVGHSLDVFTLCFQWHPDFYCPIVTAITSQRRPWPHSACSLDSASLSWLIRARRHRPPTPVLQLRIQVSLPHPIVKSSRSARTQRCTVINRPVGMTPSDWCWSWCLLNWTSRSQRSRRCGLSVDQIDC